MADNNNNNQGQQSISSKLRADSDRRVEAQRAAAKEQREQEEFARQQEEMERSFQQSRSSRFNDDYDKARKNKDPKDDENSEKKDEDTDKDKPENKDNEKDSSKFNITNPDKNQLDRLNKDKNNLSNLKSPVEFGSNIPKTPNKDISKNNKLPNSNGPKNNTDNSKPNSTTPNNRPGAIRWATRPKETAKKELNKATKKVAKEAAKRLITWAVEAIGSITWEWILAGCAILAAIIILFIAGILIFSYMGQTKLTSALSNPNPPGFVIDESVYKSLKALAGDLKARSELISETSQKILDELTTIKQEVDAGNSNKKTEILTQIEKTRQTVEKLKVAVEKSVKNPAPGNNKSSLPKYVIDARDQALTEIDKLLTLLQSEGTLALRLANQLTATEKEAFKQKGSSNCYSFSSLLIAYLTSTDETQKKQVLGYTNDTWSSYQFGTMNAAMNARGYYYTGNLPGIPSNETRVATTLKVLYNDGFMQWHVQGPGTRGHWISILNIENNTTVTYFDPADGQIHREAITNGYLNPNNNYDGVWGTAYTRDGKL